MKVYGHPGSTCTRKVLTVLAEKNAPHEFQLVDLMKGEQKKPEFLAHQPFGVVPVLEDGAFSMYESRAIIKYLDAKLPGVKLTPESLEDRARMEQWTSVEFSNFTPTAMKIIGQTVFSKWRGTTPDMAAVNTARESLTKIIDPIEAHLAKSPYFAGAQFSLADVAYMPYVEYLFAGEQGDLVSSRPAFGAWWKKVSERPSWKKVVGR